MESADVSKSVPPHQWDLGRFKTCILSTRSRSNKTCLLITTTWCYTVPLCTKLRSGSLGQSGLSLLFVALDSSRAANAVFVKAAQNEIQQGNTCWLVSFFFFFFFFLLNFSLTDLLFYVESISSCVMIYLALHVFPPVFIPSLMFLLPLSHISFLLHLPVRPCACILCGKFKCVSFHFYWSKFR